MGLGRCRGEGKIVVRSPEDIEVGGFFSRTYLSIETPFSDSIRARFRMASYLNEYYSREHYEIGKFIEQELGIKCLKRGTASSFIEWQTLLKELDIIDFLDVITAAIRFKPQRKESKDRTIVVHNLLEFTKRVFAEQNLAYRIDDGGGVHPSIDIAFSVLSSGLLRSLTSNGLEAAREHITQAERSLLKGSFDGRQAIRSTFDAAENLLKTLFPDLTQLNTINITSKLGPYLLSSTKESRIERLASEKLVKSFLDWVEAAHFYRHAAGGAEIEQPSENFTIAIVSQGLSFVRWIADVYSVQARSELDTSTE